MKRFLRSKPVLSLVALAILASAIFIPFLRSHTPAAHAATGDFVSEVTFSQDCQSGIGVGITYDGANLWYSCYASTTDLLRADPTTGVVTASYSIAGGLGSLAYDVTRNAIWAGWGNSADASAANVRLIQLDASKNVTGNSVQFSAPAALVFGLDDGIAYDATNDSLYLSDDGSKTIYHYSTTGTLLGSSTWAGAAAGSSCYNSGLGLGGSIMYQGSDGCSHVYATDKATPSGPVLFDFSTAVASDPNFRDEGLTCDPNTFASQGKQVMWSKEAYSPMRAHAYEIPAGSCGFGGAPATSGFMTGGGKVKNQTASATFGFELSCSTTSTPNNLQVNWGKGNKFHLDTLTGASCTDNPAITPNPPAAGFDTYSGSGSGRYNGTPGATAQWTFTDAGEPGTNDTVTLQVKDAAGNVVLDVSGTLSGGNIQAHNAG